MPAPTLHVVCADSRRSAAAEALPSGVRFLRCTPADFKLAAARGEVGVAIIESSAAADLHDWFERDEGEKLLWIYLDADPAGVESRHIRQLAQAYVTVRERYVRLWDTSRRTILAAVRRAGTEMFDREHVSAPLLRAVLVALRRPTPFVSVDEWALETCYERTALCRKWKEIVGPTGPTPADFINALILMHALQLKVSNIGWAKPLRALGVSKQRLIDVAARLGLPELDRLIESGVFEFVEFFDERVIAQALVPIASMKPKKRGRPPKTKTDRQTDRQTDRGVAG